MINYAPHEDATQPWKLLWWRTSALRSRKLIRNRLVPRSGHTHTVLSAARDASLVNRAHWRCGACASIATFMAHQSCLQFSLQLLPLRLRLRHRPLTFIDFNGPGFAQWLPRLAMAARANQAGKESPRVGPSPKQLIKCPQRLWLNNSLCLAVALSKRQPQWGGQHEELGCEVSLLVSRSDMQTELRGGNH